MGTDPGPGLPRISPCEYLLRASPVGTGSHTGPGACPLLSCDIRQIKAPLSKVMFALLPRWELTSWDGPSLVSDSLGRELTPETGLCGRPSIPLGGEIVFPGSEAEHTLRKNEKAWGSPAPPGVVRGTSSYLVLQVTATRGEKRHPNITRGGSPSLRGGGTGGGASPSPLGEQAEGGRL